MGHLEKSIDLLTKKWTDVSPVIKQAFLNSVEPLTVQVNGLQAQARGLRNPNSSPIIMSGIVNTARIKVFAKEGKQMRQAKDAGL